MLPEMLSLMRERVVVGSQHGVVATPQNVPSRVRVRARPSAILHFLLSQPSHLSPFLSQFEDRNEGVTTKNVGVFSKNLPRFSHYLRHFFFRSDFLQNRF